jgi:hypothetical protein
MKNGKPVGFSDLSLDFPVFSKFSTFPKKLNRTNQFSVNPQNWFRLVLSVFTKTGQFLSILKSMLLFLASKLSTKSPHRTSPHEICLMVRHLHR